MKAKSLLLTSVVGAVVVGGALTGVTVASFTDSTPAPAEDILTGSLALAVDAAPTTEGIVAAGSTAVSILTLTETAEGKNLETRRVVDNVAIAGLPGAALDVSFRETKSANEKSCTKAEGAYKTWDSSSANTHGLPISVHGKPVKTTHVCMRVGLSPQAPALLDAGEHEGTVTVSFESQQIRDGRPFGWRSSESTDPITVPIAVAPKAPQPVTCALTEARPKDTQLVMSWPSQPGVDTYRVQRIGKTPPALELHGAWQDRGNVTWSIPLSALRAGTTGQDRNEHHLQITAFADNLASPPASVTASISPNEKEVACS